jgi:hypothetical protein
MDRSEGANVTVGAVLAGFGGVIIGLLSHAAAIGIGAACVVAGLYLIAAVYRGWPRPTTATDRAFSPNLRIHEVKVLSVEGGDVFIEVPIANLGRGNVPRAVVNVLIANPVSHVYRCSRDGARHQEPGSSDEAPGSLWSRPPESLWLRGHDPVPSTIWGGYLNFEGPGTRVMYLCVGLGSERDFSLLIWMTAPELDPKRAAIQFEVTPRVGAVAREVGETGNNNAANPSETSQVPAPKR